MKIDRIELYEVAMPLISPWRTAYGEDAAVQSVLCKLSSGSVSAWGETSPFAAPCYSPEWSGGVFGVAKNWFAPQLLGQEISSGEDLQQRLSMYKGNPFAKAVFDNAWWGLESRMTNTPLHELLGATRSHVAVGADFGVMDSIDELLPDIEQAIEAGFPRIKLKFRPGWDLNMLREVRRVAPEHTIHIDCNSGYRKKDLELFQSLEKFNLAMIEQPLGHDDLIDHSWLQQQIRTPICLDETITHIRRLEQALAFRSCQYVNIKPGRVGGLTVALKMHDLCREVGIPCWVGGMLESAVGSAHCIALAMLENFTYPADIFPSSRFYHQDLSDDPIELETTNGVPGVNACPQLPDPNSQRLKAHTLQSAVFES